MTRIKKTLSFDESKIKHYEMYCKNTGRVLSRIIEIAMDEHIRKEITY